LSASTTRPFYASPGLNTETYDVRTAHDLVAQGLDRDVAFYIEEAKRTGGPVLELGGGTGRVSWALAEAGFDVVLLDLSEAMIERAEAKRSAEPGAVSARLRTVRADMSDYALDRRFQLAIAPFRAFMTLVTAEDQRRCLDTTRRHLESGGRLILHLFDPRLDLLVGEGPPNPDRGSVRHPVTGNHVRIAVLSRSVDLLRQVFEERWRFAESTAEGHLVREEEEVLRLRWTYRYEMRHLLELTGFEVEAEFSSFDRSPSVYGREQIWVSRAL